MSKRKPQFKHEGGGCMIGAKTRYPCDDSWRRKDGTRIVAYSTMDSHFAMPRQIRGPGQLRKMRGVVRVRVVRAKRGSR